MKLKFTGSFRDKLAEQVEFIARDKPIAARKFKDSLLLRIKEIPTNPYLYRRSIFFKRDDIRDLIFKGYIVVFKINKEEQLIEVFGLTRFEEKPFAK